jgi:hypothetical protein
MPTQPLPPREMHARPNGAPPYYQGRPATLWIIIMSPWTKRTAAGHARTTRHPIPGPRPWRPQVGETVRREHTATPHRHHQHHAVPVPGNSHPLPMAGSGMSSTRAARGTCGEPGARPAGTPGSGGSPQGTLGLFIRNPPAEILTGRPGLTSLPPTPDRSSGQSRHFWIGTGSEDDLAAAAGREYEVIAA